MQKIENINYDQPKFSLALIDFKQYTETLLNVDKDLDQSNFVLDYVIKRKDKSADLKGVINDIALPTFVKVKEYLEYVEKSVNKYMKDLEDFLKTHSKENAEFFAMLDVLIPLIQEKQAFIKKQLQRCFEFAKSQEQENLLK